MATSAKPLNRSQLIRLVAGEYNLGSNWRGDCWVSGFLSRHPETLAIFHGKPLEFPANGDNAVSDIQRFLKQYGKLMGRICYDPDFIINADETPCGKKQLSAGPVIGHAQALKHGATTSSTNVLRSVVPFIAASGKVWMTLYIFKGVHQRPKKGDALKLTPPQPIYAPDEDTRKRGTWPRYYASTSEGYMTAQLWGDVIRILYNLVEAQRGLKDVLLLVDHHASHHDVSTIKFLLSKNIRTLFIPAHMTFFMQPLDMHVNAVLKAKTNSLMADQLLSSAVCTKKSNSILQVVLPIAEKEVLKVRLIKSAWRDTGLWPFNIDIIHANANNQLGADYSTPRPNKSNQSTQVARRFCKRMMKFPSVDDVKPTKLILTANRAAMDKDLLKLEDLKIQEEEAAKRLQAEKLEKANQKKRKRAEDQLAKADAKLRKFEERQERKKLLQIHLEEKKNSKIGQMCRVCNKCWRSANDWYLCQVCKMFRLCPTHATEKAIIENHARQCQHGVTTFFAKKKIEDLHYKTMNNWPPTYPK
ncbi:MAG: hypothetical protein KGJ07_08175 [Patescibacteria group bacterium]|nr:hypothetical protein [Patescibacteria group bacterium]